MPFLHTKGTPASVIRPRQRASSDGANLRKPMSLTDFSMRSLAVDRFTSLCDDKADELTVETIPIAHNGRENFPPAR